jgi:hypothetical protein
VSTLPEVEKIEIIGTAAEGAGPRPVRERLLRDATGWLTAALGLALGGVAVLGGVVYVDHRDRHRIGDREAFAAVMRWVHAQNAHDLAASRASMTAGGSIEFVTRGTIAAGPHSGGSLDRTTLARFDDDCHLEILAGPVAGRANSGDQVWLFARTTCRHDDRFNHHLFNLRREQGVLKVDEIIVTN